MYSLCAGVQRLVHEEQAKVSSQKDHLDIYSDPKFAYFRSILNNLLKELQQKGIGTSKKQAEVVSKSNCGNKGFWVTIHHKSF